MSPEIAFIILNDNNLAGLESTLASINTQLDVQYECCVIDNATSSVSDGVIDGVSSKVDFYLRKEYFDIYSGIDEILPEISAKYVYIIKSGTVLAENNIINFFLNSSDRDSDFIYGNLSLAFLGGKDGLRIMPSSINADDIVDSSFSFLPSIFIKRELLLKYGFYTNELRFTHDILFFLKCLILNNCSVYYVNRILSKVQVYRHGGLSKISDEPLIAKEKIWLIDTYLPSVLGESMDKKSELVKLTTRDFSQTKIYKRAYGYLLNSLMPIYKDIKYVFLSLKTFLQLPAYKKKWAKECLSIPIIINNKNHVTYLKRLILSLEKRGYKNIYIIDNKSNYDHLLEYYKDTSYRVFQLNDNVGFCALWDTEIFDIFLDQYYIYTDSDIEIIDECPDDFVVVMHYLLNKYNLGKIGLSLLTDDLPDHFANAEEVRKWEAQFQSYRIEKLAYMARVDTTFALYKPNSFGHSYMLTAFRTSFPYAARHLPWYENTANLTAEQIHYYENAKTSSHWSSQVKV